MSPVFAKRAHARKPPTIMIPLAPLLLLPTATPWPLPSTGLPASYIVAVGQDEASGEVSKILLVAGVLAIVSTMCVLVWLRGQRKAWERRKARAEWLRAARQEPPQQRVQKSKASLVPKQAAAPAVDASPPSILQPGPDEVARAGDVLDVLGTFAAGVAAEFTDQLTAILGHAELMRQIAGQNMALAASLDAICAAAEESRRSTQQLLAFGSSSMRRSGRHLLEPLLVESSEQVRVRCGGTVEIKVSPCAAAIEGNLDELRIVFAALIQNAVEASQSGFVSIRCEAAAIDLEGDGGGQDCREVCETVRIGILDDGPGVPEGTSLEVFQPGYSTRSGGRGLGLPIAFTLAARNGGRLVLTDARAAGAATRGTLAELYLPRAHPVGLMAPPLEPAKQITVESPLVLVAEDEVLVRNLVRTLLENEGYRVLDASSGTRALHLGEEHRQEITLLVTDVTLPGIDGIDLAERLRETIPGLPVVYTSGVVQDEELTSQLLGTVQHFVQKPFTPKELTGAVRSALMERGEGSRRRILVVDDEPTVRRMVRAIIEGEGFECVVAANGAEALQHLKRARFDLVLTDIVMPVLDGLDLCRAIHAGFPTVRVIAMSGNPAGRPGLEGATAFGAELVLTKPFSRDELALALRSVLGSSDRESRAAS